MSTTENEYEITVLVEGVATYNAQEDKTWSNRERLMPRGDYKEIVQADDVSPIELNRLGFENMKEADKKKRVAESPSAINGVLIWLRRIGVASP